jgi:hypothetical protein
MLRPSTRHDKQGIDPDVVSWLHEARRKPLGCDRDTAEAPFIEGEGGRVLASAGFDLDERKSPSAPGDNVDFAARHTCATGKDPPAFQPKVPAGEGLGSAAAFLSGVPVHLESSRARA